MCHEQRLQVTTSGRLKSYSVHCHHRPLSVRIILSWRCRRILSSWVPGSTSLEAHVLLHLFVVRGLRYLERCVAAFHSHPVARSLIPHTVCSANRHQFRSCIPRSSLADSGRRYAFHQPGESLSLTFALGYSSHSPPLASLWYFHRRIISSCCLATVETATPWQHVKHQTPSCHFVGLSGSRLLMFGMLEDIMLTRRIICPFEPLCSSLCLGLLLSLGREK